MSRQVVSGVDPAVVQYLNDGDLETARAVVVDAFQLYEESDLLALAEALGIDSPFVQRLRSRSQIRTSGVAPQKGDS